MRSQCQIVLANATALTPDERTQVMADFGFLEHEISELFPPLSDFAVHFGEIRDKWTASR
jgi:hypothetical protein